MRSNRARSHPFLFPDYAAVMEAFETYVARERPRLQSPEDVARLMRPLFNGLPQEEFHILLLDTKQHLLRDEVVTIGLVDRSQIHPREVFRSAIGESCARLLLVHNHPTGDPTPSDQDIRATRQLVEAGKIIGIEVVDHVILGTRTESRTKDYISLREQRLI